MWATCLVHTDGSLKWQRRLLLSCSGEVCIDPAGLKYLCERERFFAVGKALAGLPPGLVFLGGSSFHHLSYHLIRRCASQPLGVVVFDQHNDLLPAPPGYVSCGSWLREILELPTMEKVLIIGSDPLEVLPTGAAPGAESALLAGNIPVSGIPGDKVVWIPPEYARRELARFCASVPRIYLSIDKDVLEGIGTDWGTGRLCLTGLLELLALVRRHGQLVSVDVCGELVPPRPWPSVAELAQIRRNEETNLAICRTLLAAVEAPPECDRRRF